MIQLTARLLPSAESQQAIQDTFAEFQAACLWVHENTDKRECDRNEMRKESYHDLRRVTTMASSLCHHVFSVVSTYRQALEKLSDVALNVKSILFYDNSLTIMNSRQLSLCLADGRVEIDFDLPTPDDYLTLRDKNNTLKKADLYHDAGVWYLRLYLAPNHIVYSPEGVTYAQTEHS
jgi:hypothetical protein